MARGRGSGKKSGSKPSSAARNHKQDVKQQYMSLREEAQLLGLIPTTPEGAVRDEKTPPAADPPLPALVSTAIRQGWAVPEERKPGLVDELIRVLDDPEATNKDKVGAFNALTRADQQQYERDYPEKAAKAKGGVTNNTSIVGTVVQANQNAKELIKQMVMDGQLGCFVPVQTPDESDSSSDGRLEREVETIQAPSSDQQPIGEGMED